MTMGNGTPNTASATKAATARRDQRRVVTARGVTTPDDRLGDDRDHRRGKPGEQRGDDGGVAEADVDRRQDQQRDHAGQHEQDAGDETAAECR